MSRSTPQIQREPHVQPYTDARVRVQGQSADLGLQHTLQQEGLLNGPMIKLPGSSMLQLCLHPLTTPFLSSATLRTDLVLIASSEFFTHYTTLQRCMPYLHTHILHKQITSILSPLAKACPLPQYQMCCRFTAPVSKPALLLPAQPGAAKLSTAAHCPPGFRPLPACCCHLT